MLDKSGRMCYNDKHRTLTMVVMEKGGINMTTLEMIVVGIFAVPAAIMLLKLAIIFIQGLIAVFCEYVDF